MNIQGFVTKFLSVSIAQNLAYFNILLITLGVVILKVNTGRLSKTNQLWLTFYLVYYSFAILASGIYGFDSNILSTLVAPMYFIGFYYLLSNPDQLKIFYKILTISMVISSFFTIYFYKINFNYDIAGVVGRDIDRAEGLYGDANNAALASIIAYILFNKFYTPPYNIFKAVKILILIAIFYSIFITFSTTGLLAFIVIFFILNYKFFTGMRIILLGLGIVLFYLGIFSIKSQTKELNLSQAQIVKVDNIINVLTLNVEKVDSSGRGYLLENLMYYLYKNPLLGNGLSFASKASGHNTYLGVWVDAGLFTFLYFIFVLSFYMVKTFTLELHLKLFSMSLLIALYISMLSLQTVINQPYLVVLFAFVGYIIDNSKESSHQLSFIKNKRFKIDNDRKV
ncbi:hypothetical protein [Gelidibacter mesophilus]|uniref:hypothetical protein n=1 Tax=Gelidibacter mesophilus TaxID=169050 RepID=UPI0004898410|nr:hypothetical protein [Gelidibacter mesophilus]